MYIYMNHLDLRFANICKIQLLASETKRAPVLLDFFPQEEKNTNLCDWVRV